jgi:hypothetical protein
LTSAHEELPLTLVQRLDHVCSSFESACQAAGACGPLPILEDFLKDRAEADGSVLRRELILLEVHYRRRRGEHPGAPEFAGRFPDLAPTWLAEALGTSTELPHDTPVSSAPPAARSALATDANLLFGILALQADAITRDRFVEACTLWASAKDLALADLLVQRGWLAASDRADVERLVERKLRKHSGDLKTSLAEVAGAEVHRSLSGLADTDVQHSLAGLAPALGQILPTTHTFQLESRNRYALTRLHARGGIGQVWLAHDSDLGARCRAEGTALGTVGESRDLGAFRGGGQDHRPTGTSRHRAGLRTGAPLRRSEAFLHDALCQGADAERGRQGISRQPPGRPGTAPRPPRAVRRFRGRM